MKSKTPLSSDVQSPTAIPQNRNCIRSTSRRAYCSHQQPCNVVCTKIQHSTMKICSSTLQTKKREISQALLLTSAILITSRQCPLERIMQIAQTVIRPVTLKMKSTTAKQLHRMKSPEKPIKYLKTKTVYSITEKRLVYCYQTTPTLIRAIEIPRPAPNLCQDNLERVKYRIQASLRLFLQKLKLSRPVEATTLRISFRRLFANRGGQMKVQLELSRLSSRPISRKLKQCSLTSQKFINAQTFLKSTYSISNPSSTLRKN